MDPSDKRRMEFAKDLFNKNDPGCITLYKDSGTEMARSMLARIYLEGKCGQPVDLERALEYTAGNMNYLARAIEAQINVFEYRMDANVCRKYYSDLMYIHERKPDHWMVNRVLSNMYIQGRGVEMDFAKAIEIIPQLEEQKIFNRALSSVPADLLPDVEAHIEFKGNRTWSTLLMGFYGSRKEYGNAERIAKKIDVDPSKGYSVRIKSLWKSKKYFEANAVAAQWFSEEKTEQSAFHYLRYGGKGITKEDYDLAADILEASLDRPGNLKCLVTAGREFEDWERVERCLSSECSNHRMYEYDRGRLDEHKDQIESACKHYIDSVYVDPKTGRYTRQSIDAMDRAFRLMPELVLNHRELAESLLAEHRPGYTYTVASALYDCGCKEERERGFKLLESISHESHPAADKLYEITGAEEYAKLASSLEPIGNRSTDYHFSYRDSTWVIEANYQGLPPLFKIKALDELAKRYSYKDKGNLNYDKAADYLNQEIDLCEQHHIVSKFAKAKLGLMMFDRKIPCLDDGMMYGYIFPLRSVPPYTRAVAGCLIAGRGAEVNVKEALSLLSSSDNPGDNRYLLKIYSEGRLVDRDESKMYRILKKVLSDNEPDYRDIETLNSLKIDPNRIAEESSYSDYQNSKIKALINAADSQDSRRNKVRYYDFARKCGSQKAAILEARVLIECKRERIAYSVLKTSNVDPQDELYIRIKSDDQVLIDVDTELDRFFKTAMI